MREDFVETKLAESQFTVVCVCSKVFQAVKALAKAAESFT
jgi:hypothetical protein